jgi:hypothetical protein
MAVDAFVTGEENFLIPRNTKPNMWAEDVGISDERFALAQKLIPTMYRLSTFLERNWG